VSCYTSLAVRIINVPNGTLSSRASAPGPQAVYSITQGVMKLSTFALPPYNGVGVFSSEYCVRGLLSSALLVLSTDCGHRTDNDASADKADDLVRSAHQQVTHEWWSARSAFELFVSQFVLDEAAAGDNAAAERRLHVLEDIMLLDVTEDAILLAGQLVAGGGLPPNARVDALHVAVAAANGMNYLLTWNCKHIANGSTRGRIEELCRAAGFEPPIICTPLELMQE
jgi:hypothetical protein